MTKDKAAKLLLLSVILVSVALLAEIIRDVSLKKDGDDYFIAKILSVDAEYISFEITDRGNTFYDEGEFYSVRRENIISEDVPSLVLWDYVRIECNTNNKLIRKDPKEFPMIFAIHKTDITGKTIYD